ncbi:hypothetical protein JOB18_018561 [Solea senegalensis]|uniref:Uncharacterized protein n=1 Tax=Solea senegalensis TaxID=28829 RepID=A0AAV6QLA4_SOLSE|nr:hypothetical protein JOB18_018561 [Solea senegalensis]
MVGQFLVTAPPPSIITQRGKLRAAASFSTPVEPITTAAKGQAPDSMAAAETRLEEERGRGGTGKKHEAKAAAVTGGRRWMNSILHRINQALVATADHLSPGARYCWCIISSLPP